MICVFQPHTYTRSCELDDFSRVFTCDKVVVTDIYAIEKDSGLTPRANRWYFKNTGMPYT